MSVHLALVIFVPGFLALGWWQLQRALDGNGLSWAYTFEWPFFAAYAVVLWWRIVHDERPARTLALSKARRARANERRIARDAKADEERIAYNAYLASLAKDERDGDVTSAGPSAPSAN
jgi:hypothetical protein